MIQPTYAQQQYPQQGGANAVSINIYNPQAYGTTPQANAQAPYNYTSSVYQMPQASMYQPQEAAYAQYIPMQYPQLAMLPQQQYVEQPMYAEPQFVQQPALAAIPAPQVMPESVMEQPRAQEAPKAEAQAVQKPQVAPVEVQQEQQAQPVQKIDTNALIAGLKSANPEEKAQAISKIAEHVQGVPEVALEVVSEPIMQGLIDIINEDTANLEGPTDKQIEVAQKVAKGEQLTPEEEALSEKLSPRDEANKNRIFALYTLAMIQKLQRDNLNQYIEAQKANGQEAIEPAKISDLAGYNNFINVINNDRPEVKVAAIQALAHTTEPQDLVETPQEEIDKLEQTDKNKADALRIDNELIKSVKDSLNASLRSDNEGVKTAAQEAIAKLMPQA